ncbi:MAG: PIG-L family deacetylase [Bryobacterales bacterium]|nr:PIG-L family deacetylase [Bryobacterales bacterium]
MKRLSMLAWVLWTSGIATAQPVPTHVLLERLNTLGSVLMIGAHDDDDDTQLLSYLANELHLRTGYLSLARGTGAQNRIGPEQGDAMGLLLTGEALAARRMQHVEQFYTRVFDFGFSKSLEETMSRWDRPEVLSDIVWVLRRFRPDIVIVRYSGTPRDGHGNHQASAVLARRAVTMAADAAQFPEHLKHAAVWKPARVFQWSASPAQNAVELEVGGYNASLGVSYGEMSTISRSMFRSQAMGGVPMPAARRVFLTPLDGSAGAKLLDGIDSRWTRVRGGEAVGAALRAILKTHRNDAPESSVAPLLAAREQLAALRTTAHPWVDYQLAAIEEAIAQCAGLWVRAIATQEMVTRGSTVTVMASVVNRMKTPLELASAMLGGTELLKAPVTLTPHVPSHHRGSWTVPADQPYSQPYWLGARDGQVAIVRDPLRIGEADDPPLLQVRFLLRLASREFVVTRPVRYLRFDPGEPESWRPLVVTPPATARAEEQVLVFPGTTPRTLSVRVTAQRDNRAASVKLKLAPGWKADPPSHALQIAQAGQHAVVAFRVVPPAQASDSSALASVEVDGTEITVDQTIVDYPHIERRIFFPQASVRLVRVPVRVLARKVGYVAGTGDAVPTAIAQLGCEVTMLSAADLAGADLGAYDAIVLGIRSYGVRPDISLHSGRLREYVRGGGTLLMQYTVSPRGPNAPVDVPDLAPFPFQLGAGRVTVEDSPVAFLLPSHPLLRQPNAITQSDFAGWVQERGLHFAAQWDPRFEAPLSAHDPGEASMPGGLLYARHGKGVFIYTAHAWFRQLPAGVPGAFRLFANLLSAGRTQH